MTTLYLDTEFNGHGGQLLSIALVSNNVGTFGRDFYAEVAEVTEVLDPWVLENVIPKFKGVPTPRAQIREDLRRYLLSFDNPVVVADWYADFVHFFGLFEGDDFRSSFDLPVRTVLLSGPSDIRPEVPHNAWSDARALHDYWEARAK